MKDDENITFSDINKTSHKPIYVLVLEDSESLGQYKEDLAYKARE